MRAPDGTKKCILVFGNEPGAIHDHATRIVQALAGPDADSMNIVQISEDMLKTDPGRLADEAGAISMFGGQRIIWLRDPGTTATRVATGFVASPVGDAVLVIEAGSLAKSSPLRKACEASPVAMAMACYADTAEDLNALISSVLTSHSLRIDNEARMALVALLGENRGQSRSELEKLALYCYGSESVSLDDVAAVCGDTSALSLDTMIDAAFEGDTETACRNFSGLTDIASGASAILTALARHISLLEVLRSEIDGGKSADTAVKSARPPIFFKRQASVARQLRLWTLIRLGTARKAVFDATLLCRQRPILEPELAERCLISLARSAVAARRR